jgi:hypothetical protein
MTYKITALPNNYLEVIVNEDCYTFRIQDLLSLSKSRDTCFMLVHDTQTAFTCSDAQALYDELKEYLV